MKSCNEFQESILNENITKEIMIHLENCEECKNIYDLSNKSSNELSFVLPAAVIDEEIKKAFVSANKKMKFRDFHSTDNNDIGINEQDNQLINIYRFHIANSIYYNCHHIIIVGSYNL